MAIKPLRISPDLTDFPASREVDPVNDVIAVAGIDLEDLGTHLIKRSGNDMVFQDPNSGGFLTLDQLLNGGGGLTFFNKNLTGTVTTTSTSDALLNGMFFTNPASGDYLASFYTTVRRNQKDGEVFASLYVGGVKQTESEAKFQTGKGGSARDTEGNLAIVDFPITVNGSQDVEIRWRRSGGGGSATSLVSRNFCIKR